MKAGDVFYFINFKFDDGSARNKLLIILNTPVEDEPFLVCLTTSQAKKWRLNKLGCYSEQNYYFVDSLQENFEKDTWIVFERIYEVDAAKLLNSHFKDGSVKLFELQPDLWKALKNCIAKSRDVEQIYIDMICKEAK